MTKKQRAALCVEALEKEYTELRAVEKAIEKVTNKKINEI